MQDGHLQNSLGGVMSNGAPDTLSSSNPPPTWPTQIRGPRSTQSPVLICVDLCSSVVELNRSGYRAAPDLIIPENSCHSCQGSFPGFRSFSASALTNNLRKLA
jgi:hypothetical protein